MIDREKILDRIRKLLALKARAGSEHEAAAAAFAAAKLMAEYDVAEADLPDVPGHTDEPITEDAVGGAKRKIVWQGQLAAAAARSFGCKMYYKRGEVPQSAGGGFGFRWQVCGRRRDIDASAYLYQYLVREVDRLAVDAFQCEKLQREIDTRRGEWSAPLPPQAAWKDSFRLGAAGTILARVRDARQNAVQEAVRASANPGRALMVIQRNDLALATYVAKLGLVSGRAVKIGRPDAFQAGRAAGHQVSMGSARGALGAGAGRLR